MKPVPKTILDTINNNQSFLLMAHKKPDGDAIGSTVALGKGLKAMGKTVEYCIDPDIEKKITFFSEIDYFNQYQNKHFDVAVLLDCSTLDYAYKPEGVLPTKKIMLIDHHLSNESFGDINFVELTSSTAELVFRVLEALKISFDEEMCDAVFTGISTDTGSFQHSNVTEDTHLILARLHRLCGNFSVLSKHLHEEKSYNQMKLYGKAVDSLTLYDKGLLSVVILDADTIKHYGGMVSITDDIANIGINVDSVRLAVTFKEKESNCYKVSLRTKSPYPIDASVIAKENGGGGHMRAAGFDYCGDIETMIGKLSNLIAEEGKVPDNA